MQGAIIALMEEYGNFAVFFLILIENLFPPIPSEAILTFGGVMTSHTSMTVLEVILSSTAGSVLGAVILYFAGRLISEEKMKQLLAGRVGRVLHFKPEDVDMAREWFLKKGYLTVFFCRMVPVVRSLISIPAGAAGMALAPFLFLTTIGSLIWNTVLVLLGRGAGDSWEKVAERFGAYSDLILMALGAVILLFLLFRWLRRTK